MSNEAMDYLDDDELSRRILDSAKSKGLDPAKHGIVEAPKAKPERESLALRREASIALPRAKIVALLNEAQKELERIEDSQENLRLAAGVGVTSFLIFGIINMPLWLAMLMGTACFGVVRLQQGETK